MRLVATAGIVAAVLALAACGGGGSKKEEKAATGSSLQTFSVSETDFKLSPSTYTIDKAGTYTFHAVNNGQVTHSLEIEGKGVEAKLGSNLQPGASGDLEVTLAAGSYEIYCPVDGHKQMGMKGTVSVAGGAGQPAPTQTTTTNSSSGYGY
jgi:uncharacterized cupredoxin-like copper-binding protein